VVQPFVKKPKKSSAITNLSVFLPAWNPFLGMVFESRQERESIAFDKYKR
jgi:hypothetical protein